MTPEARRAVEAECARLINLYANLNDAGRWPEVAALYTPDAVMIRPTAPEAPIHGRDAILASLLSRPPRVTRHLCTNIVVEVAGEDQATAESAILLFTGAGAGDGVPRPDPGPPKVGAYHDRLVRTGEGWRFAERRGSLLFAAAP